MPTALYDRVQTALGDQYLLIDELSPGGMSALFLAVERSLERRVVIKVLSSEWAGDAGVARFQREIAVMASLRHPHILPVYAGGAQEGLLYYVAPYIEGESLRDRIRREGALAIENAVRILSEVADALAAAHARGIVHRDVKPENILLDGEHALLADFGVARLLAAAPNDLRTGTGISVGTPGYMAPEQIAGDPTVDERADVYALAVVGYEMLAGEPPFVRENVRAIVAAHLVDEVPSLSRVRSDLPPNVATTIMHALAKDPRDRTPSAAAFRASIITDGGSAASVTRLAIERSWPRRRIPLVAALTGLLMVAGLVALVSYRQRLAAGPIRGEGAASAHSGDPQAKLAGAVAATRQTERSVAVLPFVNISSDPENEYFSDGVTEELITTIARIGGLRVPARTSSFAFKGKQATVSDIGRQLRVGTVLEGSVRRSGKRLRVTAQLVDVATGYELWSEVYDRELTDVFTVQEDIARAIATRLKIGLLPDASRRYASQQTINPEAYDLYLRGRYFWNQRTEQSLNKSIEYYQRALAIDPRYAMAYAGLADSYAILGANAFRPADDVFPKAENAAAKALALDSSLASVHATRALIKWMTWQWATAGAEFQRSIALDSSYAPARVWYALYLSGMGRGPEALREITRARELDPLSLVVNTEVGRVYELGHRDAAAANAYERVLEIDSTYDLANYLLAALHFRIGRFDSAATDVARLTRVSGPGAYADLRAYGYAVRGDTGAARRLLADLRQRQSRRYVSPYSIACIYAALGDATNALEWLDKGYGTHASDLTTIAVDPRLDPLRADARFSALIHRMGLDYISPSVAQPR